MESVENCQLFGHHRQNLDKIFLGVNIMMKKKFGVRLTQH